MGARLSSNRDYNPALTKQPRKPTGILKVEPSVNFQQYPLHQTLSIPAPMRYSQNDKRAPDTHDEVSHSESNQTSTQQNTSPIDNNQVEQIQPSSNEKQLVLSSSSHPLQSPLRLFNQPIMHQDASIIYRSVTDLNHHRRTNNNQFSFFTPQQSIVERNRKQFLTECKDRMERRFVQIFDETIGKMRIFEVVDYIPSRMVRSIKTNPQSQAQNNVPPSFSSNHRSALSTVTNQQTEPAQPSNLHDLNNHETVDREFDIYHRSGQLHPPSAGQPSNYSSIQSNVYKNSTTSSLKVPGQYAPSSHYSQPLSFRHHSLTASDYSPSPSTIQTITSGEDSESEANVRTSSAYAERVDSNRINPDVSYGTSGGRNSPVHVDPFEQKISQHDAYYRKRQGIHNYSEPVLKARRFVPSNTSDYTPLPVAHKRTNSRQYARRRGSKGYYD